LNKCVQKRYFLNIIRLSLHGVHRNTNTGIGEQSAQQEHKHYKCHSLPVVHNDGIRSHHYDRSIVSDLHQKGDKEEHSSENQKASKKGSSRVHVDQVFIHSEKKI